MESQRARCCWRHLPGQNQTHHPVGERGRDPTVPAKDTGSDVKWLLESQSCEEGGDATLSPPRRSLPMAGSRLAAALTDGAGGPAVGCQACRLAIVRSHVRALGGRCFTGAWPCMRGAGQVRVRSPGHPTQPSRNWPGPLPPRLRRGWPRRSVMAPGTVGATAFSQSHEAGPGFLVGTSPRAWQRGRGSV